MQLLPAQIAQAAVSNPKATQKFFASFQKNKGTSWLAIAALAGALLLLLSNCSAKEEAKVQTDLSAYTSQLEQRITIQLEQMEGVQKASVLITLERGNEQVYTSRADQLSATLEPKVKGALVICHGKWSETLRQQVIEAVATALGVGWHQVSVQPGQ